jgi:hypothetical protein
VYDRMKNENVGLDRFTVVSLLSSCAYVGALNIGVHLHRVASEEGFVENVFVGNALREVLVFGCGRNKGFFATNQEGDTSAYHLKLTFLKNIQLHLIIPNLIKIYIF